MADLTRAQRALLLASEPNDINGRQGVGVEIRGTQYRVAKALQDKGLGSYTQGSSIYDMYWNNGEGLQLRAALLAAPLSPEALAEILARAEAATPGPWNIHTTENDTGIYVPRDGQDYKYGIRVAYVDHCFAQFEGKFVGNDYSKAYALRQANAAFIAAARTDVPRLVNEITSLRAQLAQANTSAALADIAAERPGRGTRWRPIGDWSRDADGDGPFHLYGPSLIDLDFNEDGIVDGFFQDDAADDVGGWRAAVWVGHNADTWVDSVVHPTHFAKRVPPACHAADIAEAENAP